MLYPYKFRTQKATQNRCIIYLYNHLLSNIYGETYLKGHALIAITNPDVFEIPK